MTNLPVFAAFLRNVPMGCKAAVLTKSLQDNHTVNCLTFEEKTRQLYNENFCLSRAIVLHLR